eukprot:GFUD01034116.1.p1 GENE.GFUD01034116.1~~GFUD01034116.1.p1  ORF type:complete len:1998 (+),score=527.07 GFUD01034116.1:71-6064(+)
MGGLMEEDGESSCSEILDNDFEDSCEDWKKTRNLELGFEPQKEIVYNKVLPYATDIDKESTSWFAEIKANLGKSIALRELRPGIVTWTSRLNKFIRLYGLKFPKADHISAINLLYSFITTPDLEPFMVNHTAGTLNSLLRKRNLLDRQNLTLEWRPLYEMYERILHSHLESLGLIKIPSSIDQTLKSLVKLCRSYFTLSTTEEMLREWRPLMCPLDVTMGKAMSYFEIFLPTFSAFENPDQTYKLWFDELLGFWSACGNSPIWEPHLLSLLARLAEHNTGQVDWSLYMPVIFTRVQKMFSLPVHYNKTNVGNKGMSLDSSTAAYWIVNTLGGESLTQKYLSQLFQSLESYYHPANIGKYSIKLTEFMSKLSDIFIKRVHRERHKKHSWGFVPPSEHILSDSDITQFVNSVKPIVYHAMWSRWGFLDAGATLACLATLRPELILPTLVERLYAALETVTEPHKLTASLYSVLSVARCLVYKSKLYPEGQTHVLPLLFSVLPGIDTNDMRKSMITFQYISTFATLVPFVDHSNYVDDHPELTEEERNVCFQTSQFEDFIVEFLNRCFAIVENSEVQQIRSEVSTDDASVSREDTMKDVGMASTFSAILMQSSEKLYDVALKKVKNWINGKIMEWKVSGKIAAGLCRCLTKVRPEKGLAGLLPLILDIIEGIVKDGIRNENNLNDELKFQLMMLSEIIRVPGKYLLPYIDRIDTLLSSLVQHSSKEGNILTGAVLRNTLRSLTQTCPVEYKSSAAGYDRDLTTYQPLTDWGKSGDIHSLEIDWYIPGQEEVKVAHKLMNKVLGTQLATIGEYTANKKVLSKEELASSISFISESIVGSGVFMANWKDEIVNLKASQVDLSQRSHIVFPGVNPDLTHKSSNARQEIVMVMHKLLSFQLANFPDDTKSLRGISTIYQSLLFFTGVPKVEYDARWRSFQATKKAMENKLLGSKKIIRAILVDRCHLQHQSRMIENSNRDFTKTHQLIYDDLLLLATNHYSEVRIKGQEVLGRGMKHFSHSYQLLVPKLVELLKKDENISHEQFKGALYVILGSKGKSLLTKHNWETFAALCPAVIEASHSEKPSIIKVFSALQETVVHHLETITINFAMPDKVAQQALHLWDKVENQNNLKLTLNPSLPKPSEQEILDGQKHMDENNIKASNVFAVIVDKLCSQLESGKLHWRHYNAGVSILAVLTRYDKKMPARAVKIMVNNLIHDNIVVRKTSIHNMAALLKQNKRPHVTIERAIEKTEENIQPGNRKDNQWLQYSPENWPKTKEQWNSPNFVHKTHFGYYHWPEKMTVYAAEDKQPNLDRSLQEMTDQELEIFQFLQDETNLQKLIEFLSLEENKGRDKFDSRKFLMWKGIFRNFGLKVLEKLKEPLEKLCDDQQESSQRCAAEMMSGLIRGSKHWTWEMTENLWSWLVPVLRKLLGNVTVETIRDWGICFATASESRDPNRIHWMLEVLMEEPLRSQGSFLDSSRLYVLQGAMAQQEWRVGGLLHRLDRFLNPFLTHPYQNVRERLGSVMANIYALDIHFTSGTGGALSPNISDLLSEVLPKLELMKVEPDPEIYNYNKNSKTGTDIDQKSFEDICSKLDPELAMKVREQGLEQLKSIISRFPGGRIPSPGVVPPSGTRMPPPQILRMPSAETLKKIPPELQKMLGPGMLRMASPEMLNMMRPNLVPGGKKPTPRPGMSPPELLLPPQLLSAIHEVSLNTPQSGLLAEKWEERQSGVRLLQTVCKLVSGVLLRNWYTVKPELFKVLEMLALNESSELEPDLARDCNVALACLSTCIVPLKVLSTALTAVEHVSQSSSWKAKNAMLEFLQVHVFTNMAAFHSQTEEAARVVNIVTRLIKDDRIEVREKAGKVLGGMLHCSFISEEVASKLLDQFKLEVSRKIKKKPKLNEDASLFQENKSKAILMRHSGVLGLSAFVLSCPYDIPPHLPDILMLLADHLHGPQPIPATVKNVFQEFKRTHQDNWAEHKQKLTEDQLATLTDLLVSPSYYA